MMLDIGPIRIQILQSLKTEKGDEFTSIIALEWWYS